MGEIMGLYGFTDSFDAGLKFSGTSYGGDLKYMLFDGSFAMALGVGFNTVSVEVGSVTTDITDLIVPVYMNLDLGSGSIYLVPKSISKSVTYSDTTPSFSINQTGLTLGYQFQKEGGSFIEYNFVTWTEEINGTDKTFDISQPALGYTW